MSKLRMIATSVVSLEEASYNSATSELTITVIKPGFNKSKNRFYPAETLKRDYNVFKGAKMFVDHQTDAEVKAKPEGSVNNWAASIKDLWAEADGTVKAKSAVIDNKLKEKLDNLAKHGLLKEMGVSIRASGTGSERNVQGVKTTYVESLDRGRSVDFVTYAGAGGQVEAIEADDSNGELDVDLVTEAQLRDRRPDLISLIESSAKKEITMTVEQQLAEAQQKLALVTTERDALKTEVAQATTKIKESETAAAKATASVELTKLLETSKLPDFAKDRIRAQFKEAVKAEGMKEAIEAEESYLQKATGRKKNNGSVDNQESNREDISMDRKIKAYRAIGFTEAEAKSAAEREGR